MSGQSICSRRLSSALLVAAALVVAGCTATNPAPVVNRTTLPPIQTMPMPAPAAGAEPQGQAGGAVVGAEPGTQVMPIRSGNIESPGVGGGSGQGGFVSPGDPNLRTGPRARKRPYSEGAAQPQAAIERPGAAAVPIPVQTAPVNISTAPAPIARTTPAVTPAGAPAPTIAMAPATIPTPSPAVIAPAPAPASSGGSGVLDGVTFAWPSRGSITESFEQTSNKGLSINGKAGDPVLAAADGRVIFSGAGPRGYGNLVIVKHAGDLLSVYAHNRSLAVKEGDGVKRGQKIAELGNSGTDKPKLHFEIRQSGKPIDPVAVLPRR